MKRVISAIKNLLIGDIDDCCFQDVFKDATRYNRNIAMIFSIFAFSLIAIMFGISLFRQEFNSSRIVYMVGIVVSCLIFALAYFGKKSETAIWLSVYIAQVFYLMYGLSIGLFTRADSQTTTFMVMMVLLPIIFVDKPIHTDVILFTHIAVFSIGVFYLKDESVKYVDLTDALIFGLLAIISGTAVNYMRIRGFVLEKRLKIMSETDILTGLKNRNSFEWNLGRYTDTDKERILCIYIDVNGLHEVNNTKGHKAGDEMLQYIAKEAQDIFGEEHTYRIGGDEYVSFLFNEEIDDLTDMLQKLQQRTKLMNYHIAVGYSVQDKDNLDITKLIKDAEYMMYKQKDIYYSKARKESRKKAKIQTTASSF